MIRPLAEARGLKLTVKAPPLASAFTKNGGSGDNGCVVQTDPDKLREIVTNLLHNAIQYNRPGGTIDLRVARVNGSLEVEVEIPASASARRRGSIFSSVSIVPIRRAAATTCTPDWAWPSSRSTST